MAVFTAEFVDDLLRDLIFYSTLSQFYAPTILICQSKKKKKLRVTGRKKERACHIRTLRFH
jgi:hypothetical protein